MHFLSYIQQRDHCIVCCHPNSDSFVTSPVHSRALGFTLPKLLWKALKALSDNSLHSTDRQKQSQPATRDGSLPRVPTLSKTHHIHAQNNISSILWDTLKEKLQLWLSIECLTVWKLISVLKKCKTAGLSDKQWKTVKIFNLQCNISSCLN